MMARDWCVWAVASWAVMGALVLGWAIGARVLGGGEAERQAREDAETARRMAEQVVREARAAEREEVGR